MVHFIAFAMYFQIALQKGKFCLYAHSGLQEGLFPHALATKCGEFLFF